MKFFQEEIMMASRLILGCKTRAKDRTAVLKMKLAK